MKSNMLAQLKKLNPEKIHGNTKVTNLLTGERDRTMSQWRKQASDSAKNYKKMIHEKNTKIIPKKISNDKGNGIKKKILEFMAVRNKILKFPGI